MDSQNITLTFGIPSYKSSIPQLMDTLSSIAKSSISIGLVNYEIIVCINGEHNDKIPLLCTQYKNTRVIHTHKFRTGKAIAINKINKYASGKLLVIIDDDVIINGKTLKLLIKNIQPPTVLLAFPQRQIIPPKKLSLFNYFQWKIFNLQYSRNLFKGGDKYFTGMCFSIKKGSMPLLPHDLINDDQYLQIYFMNHYEFIKSAHVSYHGVFRYNDFKERFFRINNGRLQIKKYFNDQTIVGYESKLKRVIDYGKVIKLSPGDLICFIIYRIIYILTKLQFKYFSKSDLRWIRTAQ